MARPPTLQQPRPSAEPPGTADLFMSLYYLLLPVAIKRHVLFTAGRSRCHDLPASTLISLAGTTAAPLAFPV